MRGRLCPQPMMTGCKSQERGVCGGGCVHGVHWAGVTCLCRAKQAGPSDSIRSHLEIEAGQGHGLSIPDGGSAEAGGWWEMVEREFGPRRDRPCDM